MAKKTKSNKRKFRLIGRDAGTGRFKTVKAARKDKQGSVVERIRNFSRRKPSKKKKRGS